MYLNDHTNPFFSAEDSLLQCRRGIIDSALVSSSVGGNSGNSPQRACLPLVVTLTISGMNYNPDVESTPVRDFILGLQSVNPLVVQTFEVGTPTPLIWMLRQQTGLYIGPHLLEAHIRTGRKEALALCLPIIPLLAHPFLHWHRSLLLQDSSVYRRLAETFCLQPAIVGFAGLL